MREFSMRELCLVVSASLSYVSLYFLQVLRLYRSSTSAFFPVILHLSEKKPSCVCVDIDPWVFDNSISLLRFRSNYLCVNLSASFLRSWTFAWRVWQLHFTLSGTAATFCICDFNDSVSCASCLIWFCRSVVWYCALAKLSTAFTKVFSKFWLSHLETQ